MQLTVFGDTNESSLPSGWTKETIVVGFGDVELDLTKRPPGPDAALTVVRIAGDVRIRVPATSAVQISGVTVFGDRRLTAQTGEGPPLRVKVTGLAGDVVVESV
jgi:predicted membrane protein